MSYIWLKKYKYSKGGAIDADKLITHAENHYTEMKRTRKGMNHPRKIKRS